MLLAWAAAAQCQPAKGLNDLGVIAFEAKRYELALEHFEKARALEPENRAIRRNIAAVHQAMANDLAGNGKIDAAIARVAQALEADPENAAAQAQAGAYYLGAGKVSEALKLLESSLALDPDNSEARAMLGEALYQQNRLPEARTQWEEALRLKPDWPELREKHAKLMRESAVEEGFNQYESGHFRLSYAKALSEEMRTTVFGILEEAHETIGKNLGGLYPPGPVTVVLYDGVQFSEATDAAAHVGALYDGKIRAPITSRNSRYLSAHVMKTRLTHEYVHVILVGHLGPRLPWWLNEGLAEVFSREMDQTRKRLLERAFRGGNTHALLDLERSQRDQADAEVLAVAYAQAQAAADYLWRAGGPEKMGAFVKAIQEGKEPAEALQLAYGLDYAALEEKVAAGFR